MQATSPTPPDLDPPTDSARSAGATAQRRPGNRIMRASRNRGLTHRGEDPPAAGRHGAPHRVRLRGDRLSPFAPGNGLDIMKPGAGASDPGMVSPSTYPQTC
jgi:hypothetical protein